MIAWLVLALALVLATACGPGMEAAPDPTGWRDAWQPEPPEPPALPDQVEALRAQAVAFEASTEVGTLGVRSGVSPAGQAVVSVPLPVAPGVGGMTPALSLEYRSTLHDGELGVGWALGGLAPPIQRCDRTIALDGVSERFAFAGDDPLCWGGERLVLVAGDYGQDGAEYRTRHEPLAKIVQHAGLDARDAWFQVFTREGQVLSFGLPGGRRERTLDGEPVAWAWALRRAEDRFGNAIEALYDAPVAPGDVDPYALQLRALAYGGTGDDASRRHVRFEHEGRPDAWWGYVAGVRQGRTDRLARIVAEGPGGAVVAQIELAYAQDPASGRSRLATVARCDAAGACLPPLVLAWSDPAGLPELDFVPYGAYLGSKSALADDPVPFVTAPVRLVGDFDGDADDDLLFHTQAGWRAWDGSAQQDLLDTPTVLSWPGVLPQGDAYVEGLLLPGLDEAVPLLLDRLQPAFAMSVVEANGDGRDDVVIPYRMLEEAEPVDAWGYRYAQDVQVAVSSTPEGVPASAGFSEPVALTEALAGLAGAPIYGVVPLDHDGDGLTDLWLCQGEGYKSGHWVLARREPSGASGRYAYVPYDSGVGCSVHDELLVTSLRGTHQDLLVVPAFETGPEMPTPADFASPEAYHDDYAPRPEAERLEYLALAFTPDGGPGRLEPTGLPRDHFQRWHDRLCRNGLARAHFGRPLASAVLGLDKLADVNGDGLVDVVRFELQSGDDAADPAVMLGLDAVERWDAGVLCDAGVEADVPARLRAYLDTGDGFVPGPVLHTFHGNPHANLWLNAQRAQLYDFDLDGIVDLLLPGSGPGTGWTMVLSVGDGTYTDHPVAMPDGWPAYTDDATWRAHMDQALRVQPMTLAPTVLGRPQISFLGLVEGNPSGWPYLVNTLATLDDVPHGRLVRITDGLGAVTTFEYQAISGRGAHGLVGMHTYPRTGRPGPLTVVREHAVQASPAGDLAAERYAYHDAVADAWGHGALGFAEVERWRVGNPDDRVWLRFDYDRDDALGDYPTLGRPTEILEQRRVVHDDGRKEHWLTRTRQTYASVVEPRKGGATRLVYPARQEVEVFVREASCLEDCEPSASERLQHVVLAQERDGLGTVLASTTTRAGETYAYELKARHDDLDAWIVGRAEAWTEQSCVQGECRTRAHEATLDPATGAVLTATFAPDDPVARLETRYEHDAHGNVVAQHTTSAQGLLRTTTTTWDAEGVHPESMTNAAGHTRWVIHHPATGVPVAEVAADGVTWVHRYDGMLRPTRHERRATPLGLPDGHVTTLAYEAGGPVFDEAYAAPSALRVRTTAPDGQQHTVDYGATQEPMQHAWWGMQALDQAPPTVVGPGEQVYTSTLYDRRGRVARTSVPTWAGEQPAGYTTWRYDGVSRVTEREHPNGSVERWAYGRLAFGLETAHTDPRGAVTRTQTDAAARVAVTLDAHGTRTCFAYGPFGVLRQVARDCGDPETPWVSTFEHDVAGRITAETDPSFGKRRYAYDGFGQLVEMLPADEQPVAFDYDALGRLIARHDGDGDTVHAYDTERLGYLASSESPDGIVTDYDYDASGRLASVTLSDLLLTVPGALQLRYEHGVGDRLESIVYPAVDGEPDVRVAYRYDAAGYLRRVERADGALLWSALAADEAGRVTHERFGNGLDTLRTYEPLTGRPATIDTVGATDAVQGLAYGWHPWGELEHRTDTVTAQSEAFEHDALRRLTRATVERGGKASVVDVAYDAVGNIVAKTDVGSYAYEGGRLLAYGTGVPVPLEHDARGNVVAHGAQALAYTPFDGLRQLTEAGTTLDFRYDAEGDRFSRSAPLEDDLVVDVHGLYERRTTAGKLALAYRIPAAGRIVAQLVRTPGPAGTWIDHVQSLHDDHLGSTHVVTDEAGAVVHTVAYDPWGQARHASNWLLPLDPEAVSDLGPGFTGHPARLDADLVDMGGRAYHPQLARFFSPDPLVTDPLDAQAYGRYAYVHGRPLVATDPTGLAPEGLGDDGGGSDVRSLPRHCTDGQDCYRAVVVGDASALDTWNRTLQLFDAPNGIGQGGPDFSLGGGTGNPYSPNGIRHGTDAGQPGGSPAFTIHVTEDMCAQISGCSGAQVRRGPTYVWHAPIDDWARTAVDVATDFVPGVSQAKAAYDAYERIQNGEDPVDVLMAAGGDAILGLVPGLKVGKKLDRALDRAEDLADAAGDVKQTLRGAAGGDRAGKPFTRAGKREVRSNNANSHGGQTVCSYCGITTAPAQQSRRGITPPGNETHVDHVVPKSRNGNGSIDNGQILCRDCNLRKGDR